MSEHRPGAAALRAGCGIIAVVYALRGRPPQSNGERVVKLIREIVGRQE